MARSARRKRTRKPARRAGSPKNKPETETPTPKVPAPLDEGATIPAIGDRLDAMPEDDVERFAFALWDAGRKDEAVEFLERLAARGKDDGVPDDAPIIVDVTPNAEPDDHADTPAALDVVPEPVVTHAAPEPTAPELDEPKVTLASTPPSEAEAAPATTMTPLWALSRPLFVGGSVIAIAVAFLWGSDRINAMIDGAPAEDATPEIALAVQPAEMPEQSARTTVEAATPQTAADATAPAVEAPAAEAAEPKAPVLAAEPQAETGALQVAAHDIELPAPVPEETAQDPAPEATASIGSVPTTSDIEQVSLSQIIAEERAWQRPPQPAEPDAAPDKVQVAAEDESAPAPEPIAGVVDTGLAAAEPELQPTTEPPLDMASAPLVTLQDLADSVIAEARLPRPRPTPPPEAYALLDPVEPSHGIPDDARVIPEPDIVVHPAPEPRTQHHVAGRAPRFHNGDLQGLTIIGRVDEPGIVWSHRNGLRYYKLPRLFAERQAIRRYQERWNYPPAHYPRWKWDDDDDGWEHWDD